ncbi:LysR family transcriptional regulator [Mangrovicoccus algicola]|uniref:LysR family transcriptional regulator n=1 Tax=Mangrovicoccus algicola TaxID=2771008 RepID=A0A8J7CWE5_9RHOB|nr:LysR family transcriptional regulator [Mangrovicoccus algicola]MBE3639749.1 LysR family transcriptional regulator [Mangrovicoccus algicola]
MTMLSVHSLDGRLLRLFLEVYECNSVSRAARRLSLTQSTVSHGLERLRRALGDPLFVRDGRNIVPTAQADLLAPRIRKALAAMEALARPQDFDPTRETRPVTIACNAYELPAETAAIFRALRADSPDLPVRFVPLGPVAALRAQLESAVVDMAIGLRTGPVPQDCESQPFLADRMTVFYDAARRGRVATLEEFLAAPHAVLDFGTGQPSLLDRRLTELGLRREVHLAVPTVRLLGDMIRGTDLIATMQERFASGVLATLGACPPPLDLPGVQYDLVWHRRQSESRRHDWLRRRIAAAVTPAP